MRKVNISDDIMVFYSTRENGNMSYKYGDYYVVRDNQRRFFEAINLKQEFSYALDIQYSDIIIDIEDFPKEPKLSCDAVISVVKGAYFYLAFGDCVPFFVFDKKKKIMGFAHLGWQSICQMLHSKVIVRMLKHYASDPNDIVVYFGPAISMRSYAFSNPAQKDMVAWKNFLQYKDGMYYINLVGFIYNDIIKCGLKCNNIIYSKVDTATDDRFFSHFRSVRNPEFAEGRFIVGGGISL